MKLTYLNARGKGEYIRLVLAVAGVEYEDFRIELKDWPSYKSKMPLGQVPVIEMDGGEMMPQTYSICRLLARKHGLHGKTDLQGLQIDMVVACQEDFYRPVVDFVREPNPELKQKHRDAFVKSMPFYLEKFQNMLEEFGDGGDGFFIGDDISWADLAFLHGTSWADVYGIETPWNDFPKLKALKERIENHPRVKAWLSSRPVTPW